MFGLSLGLQQLALFNMTAMNSGHDSDLGVVVPCVWVIYPGVVVPRLRVIYLGVIVPCVRVIYLGVVVPRVWVITRGRRCAVVKVH